jgi:hypothetical protein
MTLTPTRGEGSRYHPNLLLNRRNAAQRRAYSVQSGCSQVNFHSLSVRDSHLARALCAVFRNVLS